MKIWAVFSDRCNSIARHFDNLTKTEAERVAAKMTEKSGWPHYAAPSDFDPYGFLPEDWNEEA